MSTVLGRARRSALLLCEMTSLLAPPQARRRMVDERRSHLVESERAGMSGTLELVRALRGSLDDVRSSLSARAAYGEAPLHVAIFTDSNISLAASGVFICILVPTLFAEDAAYAELVGRVSIALASTVLFGGYAVRFSRWVRSRGSSIPQP